MGTSSEAAEFFDRMYDASSVVLREFDIKELHGKTVPWKSGKAEGVTYHYTAGVSWKESVGWLNSQNNKSSSCHFYVLDRHVPEAKKIFEARGLYLPVTALLLSSVSKGTWHATWSNTRNVGIENRNAGKLIYRAGKWYWWGRKWTSEFDTVALGKIPIQLNGMWWEPYTRGQIEANIIISKRMHDFTGGLNPSWMIPHSCISSGKTDTGSLFPLSAIRDAVISGFDISDLAWLADYGEVGDGDPTCDDVGFDELRIRQGDRRYPYLSDVEESELCEGAIPVLGSKESNILYTKDALSRLWYYIPYANKPELDERTRLALWMFQKSVGLVKDTIPGPKTRAALKKRLTTFY